MNRFVLSSSMFGWLLAACMALLTPEPAVAQSPSSPEEETPVEVKLVANYDAVSPGLPLKLGVQIKVAPGWHIYFRDPGETGLPTTVDFVTPSGFKAGELNWARPKKFTDFGVTAYGYDGETTMAADVEVTHVETSATAVTFHARVTWLSCKDSCMPGEAEVELTLPVVTAGSTATPVNTQLFAGLFPGPSITPGVSKPRVLDDGQVEVESAGGNASLGLLAALVFAFIGGLILNLMPCVLPVISLKILSFVHQSGDDGKKVFRHGLWYTAGTVTTFVAMALAVVTMRGAGYLVGWGFQFQSPLFLMLLTTVVLVMSLSMFGLFYFNIQTGQGLSGLSAKKGYSGSFFTGVLATVLATPCSAPFLGTAIGFAFAQPALIVFSVFLAIGAGLAAPYLVLSAKPSWLKRIPRPGPWMEVFKQTMGFLMLGSVVWLVSIIAQQVGAACIGAILAYLLLVSFAAYLWSHLANPFASGKRKLLVVLSLVTALSVAFYALVKPALDAAQTGQTAVQAMPMADGEIDWQAFSRADLDRQLAEGKVVFVDFTAQWCLTCKVNERLAINTKRVKEAIDRLDVVAIKADWTNQNEEIRRLLAQLGRSSVPTYVVFPSDPQAKPILLSELISEQEVIDALERAAARSATN